MHPNIESEREENGRWLPEALELPGVLMTVSTANEAEVRCPSRYGFWRGGVPRAWEA